MVSPSTFPLTLSSSKGEPALRMYLSNHERLRSLVLRQAQDERCRLREHNCLPAPTGNSACGIVNQAAIRSWDKFRCNGVPDYFADYIYLEAPHSMMVLFEDHGTIRVEFDIRFDDEWRHVESNQPAKKRRILRRRIPCLDGQSHLRQVTATKRRTSNSERAYWPPSADALHGESFGSRA